MPGYIITGVRGEGKTLASVGKIKEYALRGRPIATNLDLYLDKFLPPDNEAIIYRLPDKPRLEDLEILPPAYDVDYKAEDMNGLLVLDELGTWLNARSWNDKTRLPMLNWLFLSRKLHWDIILLAQDYEMIDAQVRNTLCDYWVQSSRLDRQKIPYLAGIIEFFGFNAFLPRIHRYFVFYGFSAQNKPVEVWQFSGKEFYDGYNTNQRFLDGTEVIGGSLVDMRATYTYLPASYLSGQKSLNNLSETYQAKLSQIHSLFNIKVETMPVKKNVGSNPKLKAYILIAFLVCFLAYKFTLGGGYSFGSSITKPVQASPVQASASPVQASPVPPVPLRASASPVQASPVPASLPTKPAIEKINFIDDLLSHSQPRLFWIVEDKAHFAGAVGFYQSEQLVESFTLKELHALGVAFLRTAYGFDLLYQGKTYLVPFSLSKTKSRTIESVTDSASTSECQIKTTMTDEDIKKCTS